jgi:hypothetical protein
MEDAAFGEAEASRRVKVEGCAGVANGGRSARGRLGIGSLSLCS